MKVLAARSDEDVEVTLVVKGSPNAVKTLVNLVGAIQYNCQVGHSAMVGAFFDGDGADKISVDGLPDKLGADMAKACGSYGDSLLACIGPSTALSYNTRYDDNGNTLYDFKRVFPEA